MQRNNFVFNYFFQLMAALFKEICELSSQGSLHLGQLRLQLLRSHSGLERCGCLLERLREGGHLLFKSLYLLTICIFLSNAGLLVRFQLGEISVQTVYIDRK